MSVFTESGPSGPNDSHWTVAGRSAAWL